MFHSLHSSRGDNPPTARSRAPRTIASLAAIALVASTTTIFATSATAAVGDSSQATGQFLSGSLLGNLDLATLAELQGVATANDGTQPTQTQSDPLNATVLSALNIDIGGGIQVPLTLADIGAVSEYASSQDNGTSLGASGLVADDGAIGVGAVAPAAPPSAITLTLSDIIGGPLAAELANLSLEVGAVSASASSVAGGTPVGDYEIAGLDLVVDSTTVAGLAGTIQTAVGEVTTAVNALTGPDGSLVTGVVGAVSGVVGAVDAESATATVTVDLPGVVDPLLDDTLDSGGGVTINLATGQIRVNLAQVQGDLTALAPNQEILADAVLTSVTTQIAALVTDLTTRVEAAVAAALDAATVNVAVSLATPPVLGVSVPVADVTVTGTLGQIADGTAPVTAILAGLPVGGITQGVVLGALAPIVDGVLDPTTGAVGTLSGDLVAGVVTPVIDGVNPLLATLNSVISLTGNNQDPSPAVTGEVFTETALELTVLAQGPVASAVTLNFARASVGPNVVADVVVPPTISGVVPDNGPIAGGTVVTVTGTGFTGATGTSFDGDLGTTFVVNSDTQITVTSPAHPVGPVDVIVQKAAGDSLPATFTYTDIPVIAPTITDLVPDNGPVTGGTVVVITGSGFTGATAATFDGTPATVFTVDSDTQITVTNPAHPIGPVDVVVVKATADSLPATFTYTALPIVAPTISNLVPDNGPVDGGTVVTITGSGFTGATAATFDGTPATVFTVDSDTQITVTSPPHAAGEVDVIVVKPGGDSLPAIFTYTDVVLVVPTITNLVPDNGPVAGETVVTITGSGFIGASGATFDAFPGSAFVIDSDTQITVTSPAHAVGPVDVVVVKPGGNSLPATFTYTALAVVVPTISNLVPDNGPVTGGTAVTITGSGFTGATAATFDGAPGTVFEVDSDTQITVTSPAHTAGPVDVVVVKAGGDSLPATFTYTPLAAVLPTITSLVPDNGPVSGGTVVTITGSGFTGATGATFDALAGTVFAVVSDTQLTVTSPAHPAGPIDVVVQGVGGGSLPATFTYIPFAVVTPTISNLVPDNGPVTGGTVVTITGSGFTGASGATFDAFPGSAFVVDSDTQITVTSPAHAVGPVDVVVVKAAGNSLPATFTYTALAVVVPTITGLVPDNGPVAGGTVVTITGSGFIGTTGVTFDALPGTAFTVDSNTQITVTSPAHPVGTIDVVVQKGGGDSLPADFTYTALAIVVPTITTLVPDNGPITGGTTVTITGAGFTGATGVTFGGDPGTVFTVVSDTEVTVTSPAHAVGPVDVVVQKAGGDSLPATFTYTPLAVVVPTITSLVPDNGPAAGDTVVTITGSGFTGATGATFDLVPGTVFSVDSDTQITVTSPAHAVGPVDVVVQKAGGDSLPGTFTYTALAVVLPTTTSLVPDNGPVSGGTVVTITGSGFTGATAVTFDGDPGTVFSVDSDTQITVTSPAHAVGTIDVVVVTAGGDSLPADFTYTALGVVLPTISSLVPDNGPVIGGTVVTITGSGFTGATGVLFDGLPGTAVAVDSDTQITVTSPAHIAGPVDVVVVKAGGNSLPASFTYTETVLVVPTITSLVPDNGPVEGGTVVTITGSGFTGATGATFDAAPGTVFSVDSDTQITVTTPAHIAGPVDVVVVKAGGNSLPGTFTYTEFAIILPTITSITPDNGPDYGGTVVTIIGSGFTGSTGATFGGSPGTGFTVVSDTVITVTAPPHAAGPVDVAIVKLGGESLPEAFTYNLTTTIISVTPDHGPEDGGATVTITGSCFAGATAVVFGNTPAASFTVVDDSTITAVSPAGVGTVDVSVNGSPLCGAGQLADGFTFQASALAATGATPLLASLAALLLLVAGAGVLFARRRSIGG